MLLCCELCCFTSGSVVPNEILCQNFETFDNIICRAALTRDTWSRQALRRSAFRSVWPDDASMFGFLAKTQLARTLQIVWVAHNFLSACWPQSHLQPLGCNLS